VAIRSDLHSVTDSLRAIFHEVFGPTAITSANQIGDNQLRVRVDSDPRPNVTPSLLLFLRADILRLCSNKTPNFIALQAAHAQIANSAVVIVSARATEIGKKFEHGNRGTIGHSGGSSDSVPFNEGRYDLHLTGYC
jgi:hypothetical protein